MKKFLLTNLFLGGILACDLAWAADSTVHRTWTAAEGLWNETTSWQGGLIPKDSENGVKGETSYFTGSPASGNDFKVKFPSGGFTESTYTFFCDLANGKSVTFDTTGTSWTKGAGTYPSYWQVMTLGTYSNGGVSYPHLFTVGLPNSSPTTTKPVMTLTDGVVKVSRDDTNGSTVDFISGTWDFDDPDGDGNANGNSLTFCGTAGMPKGKVIFREGTVFKSGPITVGGYNQGNEWLIEGGDHRVRNVNIANNTDNSVDAKVRMTGGKLTVVSATMSVGCAKDRTGVLRMEGASELAIPDGDLVLGYNDTNHGKVVIADQAKATVGKTLYVGRGGHSESELTITNDASVTTTALNGGALNGSGTSTLTVAGDASLTVSNTAVFAGDQGTARLTFQNQSKGFLRNVYGGLETGSSSAKSTFYMTAKDDAEVTVSGYLYPTYAYNGKGEPYALIRVQDNARLIGTATTDSGTGATSGGFNFGSRTGTARLEIADNGYVETAARFTLSQNAKSWGELVITNNGRLVAMSESGFIVGRGKEGCGSIEVSDNGSMEVYSLALGGNYAYGNNTPGTLRMTVNGGEVKGEKSFSVNGTNSVVYLNGGHTSFASWNVGCEPKVDPEGEPVTNTVFITGGVHDIVGSGTTTLMVGNSNGFARVEMTDGELNAAAMVQIGNKSNTSGGISTPASFAMRGGKFTVAQKDASPTGDSKIICSLNGGATSEFEFTGGEIVANSIRGGNATANFYADGGKFTVLNAVSGDWAISRFTSAKLGEKGLEMNVKAGLVARSNQAFTDAEGVEGLLTKSGVGTLSVELASHHAKTHVAAGKLSLPSGIETFGEKLSIAEGAYVLVDVPAEVGEYEVLKLGAALEDAELKRILPATWAAGMNYEAVQSEEDGTVTVKCVVSAGGPSGTEVGETTTYTDKQTLVGSFKVTAGGVNVTFKESVEIVGSELVIDVPAGSTVTFEQPISSAYTSVRKIGSGQVVFKTDNPNFLGSWSQGGGTFDIASANFTDNGSGISITTDTIRYSGAEPGTLGPRVTVNGASPQKRVVVCAMNDLTFAGGWTSANGGLVKYGPGAMEIVEPGGTYALGTSNVAAGDGAVNDIPPNGASPADARVIQNGSTAGAGLQILDGKVSVKGVGATKTTVNNTQSIYLSTGYAQQSAEAEMEISDCTYNADGTTRSFFVGHNAAVEKYNHPKLTVRNAKLVSHRMQIAANGGTSKAIYPTAEFVDSTVTFESGFQVGTGNDKCHPRLRLVNTQVTQWRSGYAVGHSFCRDVQVEILSNSLLNATYHQASGANWKGIQFESGACGTIKVASGSKLQTSWFNILNTGATEAKHVDLVFDGGILEMTADNAAADHSTTTFAKPEYQGFTTQGEGMEVLIGSDVTHTFATPFRGDGTVTKTGAGTMALAAIADNGCVFRQGGATIVAEGVLDLGGTVQTFAALGGAGTVRNGTVKGALLGTVGASADAVLTIDENVSFGLAKLAVTADDPEDIMVGAKFPVAKVADMPAGLRPLTVDRQFSVIYTVEDGVLYAELGPKPGMTIMIR